MRTVAVISQKGGAGKTTLALHIAVAAELAGYSTVLIDMDPQGTAEAWSEWRKDTVGPAKTRLGAGTVPPPTPWVSAAVAHTQTGRELATTLSPSTSRACEHVITPPCHLIRRKRSTYQNRTLWMHCAPWSRDNSHPRSSGSFEAHPTLTRPGMQGWS
jgi:hypothetical protein